MKIFIPAILLFLLSCTQKKQTDQSSQAAKEIYSADTAMSNLATRIGFYKALLTYADDSAIIPREGKLPMLSKHEIDTSWAQKSIVKELTWKPVLARASQSGDMGYSFGYSIYKGADTTTYTNYCTIWRKQKDGSWKFVYDAGNNIPKPIFTFD